MTLWFILGEVIMRAIYTGIYYGDKILEDNDFELMDCTVIWEFVIDGASKGEVRI